MPQALMSSLARFTGRRGWFVVKLVLTLAGLTLAPVGCVEPSALGPTLATQRQAIALARDAYAEDLGTMRALFDSTHEARRLLLRGRVERELIERGYITPALEPDAAALENDLRDPAFQGILVTEVRLGRLTPAQAADFVHDFSLALRMRREGEAVRPSMLERLRPLEELAVNRAQGERSLSEHRARVLALLDDASRAADAMDLFARRSSLQDDPRWTGLSAIWREAVLSDPGTNSAGVGPD